MCGPERVAGSVARLERRRDLELEAAGWQRRHSVDAKRVAEFTECYRQLGFEVLTRAPQRREFEAACGDCARLACTTLLVIYTRRPVTTPAAAREPAP